MTRVLHVTECYSAGVGHAIDSAVRIASGHEHHLLWAGGPVPNHPHFRSAEEMPDGLRNRIRSFRAAVARVKPDVVHAHSSWAGVYTRLFPTEVPIIYQPHAYKFVDLSAMPPLRVAYYLGEAVMSRRTDAVVVLTPDEDRLARRLNPRVTRHRVPNVAAIRPSDDVVPSRTGVEHVVMTGRISSQKDPDFFIEVAGKVRELRSGTRFTWIGDGLAAPRERLEAAGVRVTGWLSASELAAELASPMVYFHSARYEGFPLSVLDAAAFGHPVVVRTIAAFVDTGLLGAGGAGEVARLLVDVLDDGARRRAAFAATDALNEIMSEERQRDALDRLYDHYGERERVQNRNENLHAGANRGSPGGR